MTNQTTILPRTDDKPRFVNNMFARIAPTYDFDESADGNGARSELAARVVPPFVICRRTARCLMSVPAPVTSPTKRCVVILASRPMAPILPMRWWPPVWEKCQDVSSPLPEGDTFHLPYPDNSFDAVVSGFMIRNVVDSARRPFAGSPVRPNRAVVSSV